MTVRRIKPRKKKLAPKKMTINFDKRSVRYDDTPVFDRGGRSHFQPTGLNRYGDGEGGIEAYDEDLGWNSPDMDS
jgi:hypothetical protein